MRLFITLLVPCLLHAQHEITVELSGHPSCALLMRPKPLFTKLQAVWNNDIYRRLSFLYLEVRAEYERLKKELASRLADDRGLVHEPAA